MRTDFAERPPTLSEILASPLAFAWAIGLRGDEWGRKRYGEFHAALVEEARAHDLISVVVPRNHAKTTLLSQIMTAWEIVRDTRGRQRILMASATLGLAKENVGRIRDMLDGDIEVAGQVLPVKRLFPWAAPVNPHGSSGPTASFNVAGRSGPGKEPTVFTGSPGTALAGRRFTLAILDDVVNEQNCATREQREKVIAFIAQVEALRYDRKHTPIRAVSTPWAPGDLTSHLAARPGWRQVRHPLFVGGGREAVVCPSFINLEEALEMEATAKTTGRYAFFSAQYLLDPIASDQPLFTSELWAGAHRPGLLRSAVARFPHILLWDPVATVDATTASIDRNGIAVLAVVPAAALPYEVADPRRNVFIPVFTGEIAGGADDALRQVEDWVSRKLWPALEEIWIEEVAAQSFLAPWAKERGRMGDVRVRGQKIPAKSLTLRLSGLQTAMREGYFVVPDDLEGGGLLRQRLTEFPRSDYDDLPAALCLLSYHWERRGHFFDDAPPPLKRSFEDGGPPPRHDPPGVIVF